MKALYGQPVFAVDGTTFYWEDVVLDAIRVGTWNRLEQETRAGSTALQTIEASGRDADFDAAITEAAQEFRYARELLTADEMKNWLAVRDISLPEWLEHISRQVARSRFPSHSGATLDREPVDAEELEARMRVDLLCSGSGEEMARHLAEAVAASSALGSPMPPVPPSTPSRLPPGLPAERAGERHDLLLRIVAGAQEFRRVAVTPEAIRREISHHHTDWIRIDSRAIAFGDAAGASEAALCLREDGLSLEEVADDARTTVAESRFYLDDLDADWRSLFMAARPADLLGPLVSDGTHALFKVMEKVMPSEQDPEIFRRAEAGVAARIIAEQARQRVQWKLPW